MPASTLRSTLLRTLLSTSSGMLRCSKSRVYYTGSVYWAAVKGGGRGGFIRRELAGSAFNLNVAQCLKYVRLTQSPVVPLVHVGLLALQTSRAANGQQIWKQQRRRRVLRKAEARLKGVQRCKEALSRDAYPDDYSNDM